MVQWYVGMKLEDIEKEIILAALKHFQDNRTHTAAALGISTRTIQNKLHQYGLAGAPDDSGEDMPAAVIAEAADAPRRRGRPPMAK